MRRRNFLATGDQTATGQLLTEPVDMRHLLTRALEESEYYAKLARFAEENRGSAIRRGMGIAAFMHGSGFTGSGERRLNSVVGVELLADGRPQLLVSSTEFGQGTNTILCQVAAQALRIPYEQVAIAQPDTQVVPNSGPTVASRTAMIVGKLVERASTHLLDTLRAENDLPLNHTPEQFTEAAVAYLGRHGSLRCSVRYEPVKPVEWNDELFHGDAYPAYAWAVYVAEVAVDLNTYSASVTRFDALQEVGRIMHPVLAKGQIEGGVAQGIGYALYEKCVWKDGRMMNNQMTKTTSCQPAPTCPRFMFILRRFRVCTDRAEAKGIGELPMDGPAPAILNAIENATGLSFDSIPLLPEDIFERISGFTDQGHGGSNELDPERLGEFLPEVNA